LFGGGSKPPALRLKQRRYPINQAIIYAGTHAVDDDWTGDGEHFGGGAENKAF